MCIREKFKVPRGTHYELCRSVHSEANAIISAARKNMIGATLYLVGKDCGTGKLVEDANSCAMCKRLIINSGIKQVIVRVSGDKYNIIDVEDWIREDDSLDMITGY